MIKTKLGLIFILAIFAASCSEDCKFNAIATDSLPDGTVGTEYYYKIEIETSCSAPFRKVEKIEGELPTGISLETSGEFMGTPTESGTFTFLIQARICFGSNGFEWVDCSDKTKQFTLKINQ